VTLEFVIAGSLRWHKRCICEYHVSSYCIALRAHVLIFDVHPHPKKMMMMMENGDEGEVGLYEGE
jgi:hypothetical protein